MVEEGGTPGRDRTCDPPLRRRMLYPLSYGGVCYSLIRSGIPIVDAELSLGEECPRGQGLWVDFDRRIWRASGSFLGSTSWGAIVDRLHVRAHRGVIEIVVRERSGRSVVAEIKVAALLTAYFRGSHADVIVTKILEGYELYGERMESRISVASIYLEQVVDDDIGVGLASKHGVPMFETIGEALAVGGTGVNVDGVLIIGEHGHYYENELGQQIYPRRRFFDAAIAAMVAAGRFVPIFNDKHLDQLWVDAASMTTTAKRFGVPMVAGSTLPLAWRNPALDWPLGVEVSDALVIAYGPIERYGFHALEALQCMVERRAGGETGVRSVQCLEGEAVWEAGREGRWSQDLFDAALATIPTPADADPARDTPNPVAFCVEYRSGLRGTVILLDEFVSSFGFAARRDGQIDACEFFLQDYPPHGHFTFLLRKIESMLLTGVAPSPIERTLLTTGILDAAMHSRWQGYVTRETPELDVVYQAVESVPETGLGHPLPERKPFSLG